MGCGGSKPQQEGSVNGSDATAKARNASIDKQLRADKQAEARIIKMLLLGAGESGKSTVIKQMRLMHEGTYSDNDRADYKEVVLSNLLQSMQAVLNALEKLDLSLQSQDSQRKAHLLLDIEDPCDQGEDMNPKVADAMLHLWQDPTVRQAVSRRSEFQLNDSAQYYFDAIARLAAPGYTPNDSDILRSRVKTTGIQQSEFHVKGHTFRMFDVGGQRSERKKWIHCFEDVNVLLFLVAISEYDQMLYEDENVSRMTESMNLFDSIVNSRWFIKSTIMVFLNKIDLFEEKLQRAPLSDYMPEYQGPNDFDSASKFMVTLFKSLHRNTDKTIYTHLTMATDTTHLSKVLTAVQDTIIQSRLMAAGLL